LEPLSIYKRHEELVTEMLRRSWNHHTPVDAKELTELVSNLPSEHKHHKINKINSLKLLLDRCPKCQQLHESLALEKYSA
jgi:hypothetical protein